MKPIIITIAQTNTGAIILMLVLLLIAAAIGYFTAWFYSKSVYSPVIKGLNADKSELNRTVELQKDNIDKLNGKADRYIDKISKLEEEMAEKEKELKQLKKPKEKPQEKIKVKVKEKQKEKPKVRPKKKP
jgi:peptidoglycan hydrolase CwlO-like protein